MTAQQNGKEFEKYIDEILRTNYKEVYNEKIIRQKYDFITGIDHILKINNIIICIQDKLTNRKITNSQINHFISGINQLKTIIDNINYFYIGLYISKKPFSAYAQKIANINYISSIHDEDVNKIKIKLFIFLYDFNNLSN